MPLLLVILLAATSVDEIRNCVFVLTFLRIGGAGLQLVRNVQLFP
jgi:hypothetical protein